MKALIFDTETTGMIKRKEEVWHPDQPHIVQLAAVVVETDKWEITTRFSTLVRLGKGVEIHPKAEEVHGISAETCSKYGLDAGFACATFNELCGLSDVLVAHNLDFDLHVLRSAFWRLGHTDETEHKRTCCTMKSSTNILKLPGKFNGYKWPTLAEAYLHFVGEELEGGHDAMVDVMACGDVYHELVELGKA